MNDKTINLAWIMSQKERYSWYVLFKTILVFVFTSLLILGYCLCQQASFVGIIAIIVAIKELIWVFDQKFKTDFELVLEDKEK